MQRIKGAPIKKCRIAIVICVVLSLLVLLQYQSLRVQTKNNQLLQTQNFADSLQPGRACGILSPKKVTAIFSQNLEPSGTIIPSSAVTAKTRFNAPRIDSCSYTGADTNANYVDLVIKTYQSQQNAQVAFIHDTQTVIEISQRAPLQGTQKLAYTAGVYYALTGNEVIELGAGKQGMQLEPSSESFVRSILVQVVEDL